MCYYIGIEDLAANAMIEILEKSRRKQGFLEIILFLNHLIPF